jgi:hypothetical protein
MKRVIALVLSLFMALDVSAQGAPFKGTFIAATIAFGSVTVAYTTFLANTNSLVDLDILNLTDASITCQNTGSTNPWTIPAYSSQTIKLRDVGLYANGNISCKYTTVAPTVGSVVVQGSY